MLHLASPSSSDPIVARRIPVATPRAADLGSRRARRSPAAARRRVTRYPAFGWQVFAGATDASLACLMDDGRHELTTSGRAAIFLALGALGVAAGDHVLVPTYHCPTMISPVIEAGAHPVFYPLGPQGGADMDALDRLVRGQQIRALLAAHFFGLMQPMAQLRAWCDRHDVRLIEDCAHALFGRSDGRPTGSWGDAAIGSLPKFLPTGEGGVLRINRDDIARPSLERRGWGAEAKALASLLEEGASNARLFGLNTAIRTAVWLARSVRGASAAPGSAPDTEATATADANSWLHAARIDARLARRHASRTCGLVARFAHAGRIVERRRSNYLHLAHALAGRAGVTLPFERLADGCAPYVLPVIVEDADAHFLQLRERGIPVLRWDRTWPGMPAFAGDTGALWARKLLQLPCHQDLAPVDLAGIASAFGPAQ